MFARLAVILTVQFTLVQNGPCCEFVYKPKLWVFVLFLLVFEEPEDPSSRSFFSEIISSISDVKFSHSGRYMMTRDYLSVKVWDLNMENRPVETYQVQKHTHLVTGNKSNKGENNHSSV